MSAATVSARVRRFVLAGVIFLLAWRVGVLVGVPRSTEVALGLLGFVFHVLFGKAYALVPSYFERELSVPAGPVVQLPLSATGAAALAVSPLEGAPAWLAPLGALAWTLGVGVFLATLIGTLRGNLTGAATGTGEPNAHRRRLDRWANLAIPVALGYLAVGSYALLAPAVGLPRVVDGYRPRAIHLLAAGTATLFVVGVGLRLLPRFLVATPPRWLALPTIGLAAVAPGLLAATLPTGWPFRLAALLQAGAIVGFAAVVFALFRRSDRRRVGVYGIILGAAFGLLAVALGVGFAFGHATAGLVRAHLRTNLLGFLGLTIVGVTYQFYPPAVGTFPGAGDRTAAASIACLAAGLLLEVAGLAAGIGPVAVAGGAVILLGAALWAFLLGGLFRQR